MRKMGTSKNPVDSTSPSRASTCCTFATFQLPSNCFQNTPPYPPSGWNGQEGGWKRPARSNAGVSFKKFKTEAAMTAAAVRRCKVRKRASLECCGSRCHKGRWLTSRRRTGCHQWHDNVSTRGEPPTPEPFRYNRPGGHARAAGVSCVCRLNGSKQWP